MRSSCHRRAAGFTLIEVVFGAGLLAVAATVFAALYPVSARLENSARNRAQAVRIARREMEALRRLPFGTLVNLAELKAATPAVVESAASSTQPYPFTNLAGDGSDACASALPGGVGEVRIEDVLPADPSTVSAVQTNLRRLSVTVRWTERGQTRSVVLQSLVSYLEAPKS